MTTEDKRQAAIIEKAKAFVVAEIRRIVNDFEQKDGITLRVGGKLA